MPNPQTRSTRALPTEERNAVMLVCGVIFAAHLALAGGTNGTALAITLAYALAVLALLVPRWGRASAPVSKGFLVTAALFAMVIAAALLSLRPIRLDPPHAAWALVGAPSTASVDRSRTALEIIKLLGLACIFVAGTVLGRSELRARALFKALGGFSLVYALWSFISFIALPGAYMGVGTAPWTNRLNASFLSANTAGTVFGMLVILGVGLMIFGLGQRPHTAPGRSSLEQQLSAAAAPGALALVAATALLLTASRSAITATGAMLLVFVVAEGLARRWGWRVYGFVLLPAALVSVAIVLGLSGGAFFQRLGFVDADAASRANIYGLHILAMKPYPWQGLGLGTFDPVHRQLINAPEFGSLWNIRAMHNVYLSWREGAGWLGAIPMFLCIGLILLFIMAGATRRSMTGSLQRVIIAISGIALLHGATDFALEEFSVAGFWALLLGCGLALSTDYS